MIKPIIVYYGGKRKNAPYIVPLIRDHLAEDGTYYEPFVGGGAVWLALEHNKNVIADVLPDLINMYECLQENPQQVLFHYSHLKNDRENYYIIRNLDRNPNFYKVSKYFKAARFIYLTITGYGCVRYNSKGLHNQSYFRFPERDISLNQEDFYGTHNLLKNTEVKLQSFKETLKLPREGDFVYLDPPYIETKDSFYDKNFQFEDMVKLKKCCDELTERGVKFALSHSKNNKVNYLFKDYKKRELRAKRSMKRTKRSYVRSESDYLITNF